MPVQHVAKQSSFNKTGRLLSRVYNEELLSQGQLRQYICSLMLTAVTLVLRHAVAVVEDYMIHL